MLLLRTVVLVASVLAALAVAPAAHAGDVAIGLTGASATAPQLVTFDTSGRIHDLVDVAGIGVGYEAEAIAVEPDAATVYLLATSGTNGRMLSVDLRSGAATLVGGVDFSTTLPAGISWSMAYNPSSPSLQVVGSDGTNLKLMVRPANTLVRVDVNTPISPSTSVISHAFDRALLSGANWGTTSLAIDDLGDDLIQIGSPGGQDNIVTGVTSKVADIGIPLGVGDSLAFGQTNTLYLADTDRAAAPFTKLYTIDPITAALTPIAELRPAVRSIAFIRVARVAPFFWMDNESAGVMRVPIRRSAGLAFETTVSFTTADGSAVAGADYIATSGTVTIPAGAAEASISVPIIVDSIREPEENFSLLLTGSTASPVDSARSTMTITEFGAPPAPTPPAPAPTPPTVPAVPAAPEPIRPDKIAPIVLALSPSSVSVRAWRRSPREILYSCSEACTVTASLAAGRTNIAVSGSDKLAGAGRGGIEIRLPRASATLLARRVAAARTKRVALVLRLRVVDAAGNASITLLRTVAVV